MTYNEILPRVGKRPYNRLDPVPFATRYTDVRQMLEKEKMQGMNGSKLLEVLAGSFNSQETTQSLGSEQKNCF